MTTDEDRVSRWPPYSHWPGSTALRQSRLPENSTITFLQSLLVNWKRNQKVWFDCTFKSSQVYWIKMSACMLFNALHLWHGNILIGSEINQIQWFSVAFFISSRIALFTGSAINLLQFNIHDYSWRGDSHHWMGLVQQLFIHRFQHDQRRPCRSRDSYA